MKKLLNKKGFTLSEVLVAMLILLMVTAIVAAGIPAATNAYDKIMKASNAQMVLSSTITKLRDEIGSALDVSYDGTTINYKDFRGNKNTIYLATGDNPGIYITESAGLDEDLTYTHSLISEKVSNNILYTTYEIDSYEHRILTLNNLEVHNGDNVLAELDTVKIMVMSYIE